LLKPGGLTVEEMTQMRSHTLIGARILGGSRFPLLHLAAEIALTHHERWDGTGYPAGLAGEAIPLVGRIVAVVDVFDALTHDRPYKAAWSAEAALAEIARQSGRQFDPRVVEEFLHLLAQRPTAQDEIAPATPALVAGLVGRRP
jgi:putative two-component system response regulator